MKIRSITYFRARSLRYKLLTLATYFILISGLILAIMPIILWLKTEMLPKLPWGRSFRASVLIELPSQPLPKFVIDHPEHVYAYQSQPKLELVGIGKAIDTKSLPATIEISLFPQYRDSILKVDSRAEFYFDSPSLALLVQKIRFGKKGKQLGAILTQIQSELQQSMQRLWPFLKEAFKKYFNESELRQLANDPYLLSTIQIAFLSEVQTRLNIKKVKADLSNIPEFEQLLSLATGELSSSKLSKKTLSGMFQGSKQAYKDTTQEVKVLWQDKVLLKDSFNCFIHAVSHSGEWSTRILSALIHNQDSRLCNQVYKSMNGVVISGLKEGAKEFSSQAWDNLDREKATVIKLGKSASSKVVDELKVKPIMLGFWHTLEAHQELQSYIIKQYGQSSWLKLKKVFIDLSISPQVDSELSKLTSVFEKFIEQFFSLLLLNEQQNGPNPLLVTMLQEKLSGIKRSVVWIRPGQSEQSIGPGHRLKSGW